MEFKLVLKEEEIRLLGQSIMELPTKFGMPLIEKIQKQVNEQLPQADSKPSQVRAESPVKEEVVEETV